ncbi:hypothetical protein D4Q80_01810, partial [bacterium]
IEVGPGQEFTVTGRGANGFINNNLQGALATPAAPALYSGNQEAKITRNVSTGTSYFDAGIKHVGWNESFKPVYNIEAVPGNYNNPVTVTQELTMQDLGAPNASARTVWSVTDRGNLCVNNEGDFVIRHSQGLVALNRNTELGVSVPRTTISNWRGAPFAQAQNVYRAKGTLELLYSIQPVYKVKRDNRGNTILKNGRPIFILDDNGNPIIESIKPTIESLYTAKGFRGQIEVGGGNLPAIVFGRVYQTYRPSAVNLDYKGVTVKANDAKPINAYVGDLEPGNGLLASFSIEHYAYDKSGKLDEDKYGKNSFRYLLSGPSFSSGFNTATTKNAFGILAFNDYPYKWYGGAPGSEFVYSYSDKAMHYYDPSGGVDPEKISADFEAQDVQNIIDNIGKVGAQQAFDAFETEVKTRLDTEVTTSVDENKHRLTLQDLIIQRKIRNEALLIAYANKVGIKRADFGSVYPEDLREKLSKISLESRVDEVSRATGKPLEELRRMDAYFAILRLFTKVGPSSNALSAFSPVGGNCVALSFVADAYTDKLRAAGIISRWTIGQAVFPKAGKDGRKGHVAGVIDLDLVNQWAFREMSQQKDLSSIFRLKDYEYQGDDGKSHPAREQEGFYLKLNGQLAAIRPGQAGKWEISYIRTGAGGRKEVVPYQALSFDEMRQLSNSGALAGFDRRETFGNNLYTIWLAKAGSSHEGMQNKTEVSRIAGELAATSPLLLAAPLYYLRNNYQIDKVLVTGEGAISVDFKESGVNGAGPKGAVVRVQDDATNLGPISYVDKRSGVKNGSPITTEAALVTIKNVGPFTVREKINPFTGQPSYTYYYEGRKLQKDRSPIAVGKSGNEWVYFVRRRGKTEYYHVFGSGDTNGYNRKVIQEGEFSKLYTDTYGKPQVKVGAAILSIIPKILSAPGKYAADPILGGAYGMFTNTVAYGISWLFDKKGGREGREIMWDQVRLSWHNFAANNFLTQLTKLVAPRWQWLNKWTADYDAKSKAIGRSYGITAADGAGITGLYNSMNRQARLIMAGKYDNPHDGEYYSRGAGNIAMNLGTIAVAHVAKETKTAFETVALAGIGGAVFGKGVTAPQAFLRALKAVGASTVFNEVTYWTSGGLNGGRFLNGGEESSIAFYSGIAPQIQGLPPGLQQLVNPTTWGQAARSAALISGLSVGGTKVLNMIDGEPLAVIEHKPTGGIDLGTSLNKTWQVNNKYITQFAIQFGTTLAMHGINMGLNRQSVRLQQQVREQTISSTGTPSPGLRNQLILNNALKGMVNMGVTFGNIDMIVNNYLYSHQITKPGWKGFLDTLKFSGKSFAGWDFDIDENGDLIDKGFKFKGASLGGALGGGLGLVSGVAYNSSLRYSKFWTKNWLGKGLRVIGKGLNFMYNPRYAAGKDIGGFHRFSQKLVSFGMWPTTAVVARRIFDKNMTHKDMWDTIAWATFARVLAEPGKFTNWLTRTGENGKLMELGRGADFGRQWALNGMGAAVNIGKDIAVGAYEAHSGIPLGTPISGWRFFDYKASLGSDKETQMARIVENAGLLQEARKGNIQAEIALRQEGFSGLLSGISTPGEFVVSGIKGLIYGRLSAWAVSPKGIAYLKGVGKHTGDYGRYEERPLTVGWIKSRTVQIYGDGMTQLALDSVEGAIKWPFVSMVMDGGRPVWDTAFGMVEKGVDQLIFGVNKEQPILGWNLPVYDEYGRQLGHVRSLFRQQIGEGAYAPLAFFGKGIMNKGLPREEFKSLVASSEFFNHERERTWIAAAKHGK